MGGRRNGGPTGTPTPGADATTDPTQIGENMDGGVGFHSTRGAERVRD